MKAIARRWWLRISELWKTVFQGSTAPRRLSPLEEYERRLQNEEVLADFETIRLILDALNMNPHAHDRIEYRLTHSMESRYKNIDQLVETLQKANQSMAQHVTINYGPLLNDREVVSLDDYMTSNQGLVIRSQSIVSLVDFCLIAYEQMLGELHTLGRTDLINYYKRVYALFFLELREILMHLIELRTPTFQR